MDPQQLEDISKEIQALHKSMKNVMEMAFAVSPLLALSTHGWASKAINSMYLLRVTAISVLFLLLINRRQDLRSSWQRPPPNTRETRRPCPRGHYCHFGREVT
jgi:hypothetical protein